MADSLLDVIFEVVDFAIDVSDTINRRKRLSKPDIVRLERRVVYAGRKPACCSAARASSEPSASRKACTAGRCSRAITSAKS
ncbi:hypothetical protein ACVWY3_004531 [Bradyrhizobium sp. USDA 4486]